MNANRLKGWLTTPRIYLIFSVFFVVWMLFFDGDNMLKQWELYREYRDLSDQKAFLSEEIRQVSERKAQLEKPGELERYARETYYFHKEDEEIIAIEYTELPDPVPPQKGR